MGWIALYCGVQSALLAQRASVIGVEPEERLVAFGLPGSFLAAGASALLIRWVLA